MATVRVPQLPNGYPTSDGRPMAETDWHRDLMSESIQTLKRRYAKDENVYVSGNLLMFYVPGNKRKHVSPDVFVVKGVPNGDRPNYLVWEEGKGPDFIAEMTSSSTRNEDLNTKFELYQNVLKVPEYILFDPRGDYLDPRLRGYRLFRGKYRPIRLVEGRLPSKVLGLHLEGDGEQLRFFDPATGEWIPTVAEALAKAVAARQETEAAQQRVEAENERLRQELETLRRSVKE